MVAGYHVTGDYETFTYHDDISYTKNVSLYGLDMEINILEMESVVEKVSCILVFITPDAFFKICKNASYSP